MITNEMKANEEWSPVVGYESYYEVSNTGKVKRLARSYESTFREVHLSEKVYENRNVNKYHTVNLKGEVSKPSYPHSVHRLVAMSFIPNPENYPCVNHKDGIKGNNHIDNLEWCTYSENTIHAFKNGLKVPSEGTGRTGIEHYRATKVIQLKKDGSFVAEYECLADAVIETKINQGNISSVLTKKRKTAGGFIWEYKK